MLWLTPMRALGDVLAGLDAPGSTDTRVGRATSGASMTREGEADRDEGAEDTADWREICVDDTATGVD